MNTKGLSFKNVDVDLGTKLVLLDTAGQIKYNLYNC